MPVFNPCRTLRSTAKHGEHGFTLIEALTVVAILAILLTIAIPNLRDFILKTKVSGLSNEFSGALQQSRALAISNNACVTLCAATGITGSATGTCSTATGTNYQSGWIIFKNPSCSDTQTDPTVSGGSVLAVRQGESDGYQIKPADEVLKSIMFDPRGGAALTVPGVFQVFPPSGSPSSFNRNICVDASGRASVRQYNAAGCL